jgi:hypothetical protein
MGHFFQYWLGKVIGTKNERELKRVSTRIAGYSSIAITQRYCHLQADAIERAFQRMARIQEVVTDGGHREKALVAGESAEGEISPITTTT